MKINFTHARPQDADVIAFIVTKGTFAGFEFPLEKTDIIRATAKLARFEGAAGQSFLLINEQDGKLVRIMLLGVAEDEAADYQKAGGDIIAKVQTSGAKHIAVHGANLTAQHAAEVAFGATLRNWRMDKYRTKLPDNRRPTQLPEWRLVRASHTFRILWKNRTCTD
jgi:leucyl aminopeptidase